jgi:transposase InsO family protein
MHGQDFITGVSVAWIVACLIDHCISPTSIGNDNGSKFISNALTNWGTTLRIKSIATAVQIPLQNGYIESFHSRLRGEFFEREEFEDVSNAQAKVSWYWWNMPYRRSLAHWDMQLRTSSPLPVV